MDSKLMEQNILDRIKETETDRSDARSLVAYHKKAVDEAESRLIAASITLTNLKEELRMHLAKYPHYQEGQREKDIREFRERHPELIKKFEE